MNEDEIIYNRKETASRVDEYIKMMDEVKLGELIKLVQADYEQKTDEHYFDEIRQLLDDLDGEPKSERCYFIFLINKQKPELSTILLCHKFQVSEGFFRSNRIVHKEEWLKSYNYMLNMDVREFMLEASHGVWEHSISKEPFLIPSSM